ncbi:MAG: glycosyltransferase family 39 protein [Saprospiraceae bacterium]|nr:glycosyltransferase family 39 protein [Saprospiraceae bacterium]
MALIKRISFPALLALLWMISIVMVNPIGEFPLNDDWAFARAVYNLIEKGELILGDWPAITLVAQLYWGALFCKIFGLSLTVLRISTLVSSFIGVIAFYGIARQITQNKEVAGLAGLILFFNPLYFSLSFTFMNNVHFLCACLLAFWFLSKNIERPNLLHWILGTLFCIITTLIRQSGLLIPFVFMILGWIQTKRTLGNILKQTIPFLATLAAYLLYMRWLEVGTSNPQAVRGVGDLIAGIFDNSLSYYFYRSVSVLLYVGFFLLPFLLASIKPSISGTRRSWLIKGVIGAGLLVVLYLGSVFFPIGNIFYNFGLGPKLLKDTYWGDNITPQLPEAIWKGLRYPAILATVLYVFKFPWNIRSLKASFYPGPAQAHRLIRLGILMVVLIYVGFLSISPYFFDRYTLPLLAFALLLILPVTTKLSATSKKIGYGVLAVYAVFSLIGTHHYLSWNRTRWDALTQLMEEKGIAPTHIDGGFEFNAWLETGPFNKEDKHGKSWWFVMEDDYVASSGRIKDFEVRETHPVPAVWPFHRDTLFILWHMVDGMTVYENYPITCGAETVSPDPYYFTSNLPQIKFHHELAQSEEKAHSGQYSMALTEGKEYGFSTVLKDIRAGDQITVRVWRWDGTRSSGLVISNYEGENYYIFEKTNVIQEKDGWQQLELKVQIPTEPGFDKVGIYVWNPVKVDAWFDDIEIDRKAAQDKKEVVE